MWKILQGDAREIPLADHSVQCVVTSPPYWGLRDFGLNGAGLGLEPTPDLYVEHIVEIFREVWRVLRDDGTCWINLGDSYNANQGIGFNAYSKTRPHLTGEGIGQKRLDDRNRNTAIKRPPGLKPKDLVGVPWRVALALQADDWYLRSDIIWSKKNPMPESCTDRPTKSHEYLFLLTKSQRYYYDADAVREAHVEPGRIQTRYSKGYVTTAEEGSKRASGVRNEKPTNESPGYNPAGRNLRSVWNIATQPYSEAHFATFPEKLVEPCIKAGTSEKGACAECGSPWERVVERNVPTDPGRGDGSELRDTEGLSPRATSAAQRRLGRQYQDQLNSNPSKTLGWQPTCNHDHDPIPCLVLDPFSGSGTVGVVCLKLGRSFVGLDLKAEYNHMAFKRIHNSGSLFAGVAGQREEKS